MKRIRLYVVLIVLLIFACLWAETQSWQAPPVNVRATVNSLAPASQQAMNSGNRERVDAVVTQIRQSLGEWAGHTEVETKYYKPVNSSSPPSLAQIREGWNALFASTESQYKGNGHWRSPGPAPLRETCDVILGYSDAVKADAGDRDLLLRRIREGLDYLLVIQAANGVFPFPDLRGKDPFFGPMLERLMVQHPKHYSEWLDD